MARLGAIGELVAEFKDALVEVVKGRDIPLVGVSFLCLLTIVPLFVLLFFVIWCLGWVIAGAQNLTLWLRKQQVK
jgi:hypothetical protein